MSHQFRFYQLFALLILLLVISIGACRSQSSQPSASSTSSAPSPSPASATPEATAERAVVEPPLLLYQGPAEMGSPDERKCASLQLDGAMSATLGGCDGTSSAVAVGDRTVSDLIAWQERIAPFTYETATETLTFNGKGTASSDAWQRALLAWARARHAELAAGRTSATINTSMSWHVGQDFSQKNICMHLTVLDYGYAQAEEILCEGQDVVTVASAWLTDDEMAQFDQWLYQLAPLSVANNYLNGVGAQALNPETNPEDVAEISEWAANLWQRIHTSGAQVTGAAATVCPEAQDGLGMARDYQRGFCLLVPGDYTVFDTEPNAIVIAVDSLLNVSAPRLQIMTTSAEGLSAAAIADEVVAANNGANIARSDTEMSGVPAVVLDNVPGQDLGRHVIAVRNDIRYELTFTPIGHAELESFYATIMAHFTLIDREPRPDAITATPILTWHREGGIAGFCNDIVVDPGGAVVISTCQSAQPEVVANLMLDAEQMAQFNAWMERLQPFVFDQKDPATADAMTIQVVFNGMGTTPSTAEEQAAIAEFAQSLLNQLGESPTGLGGSN